MKHLLRKLLLIIPLLLGIHTLRAQTTLYGNEWIDYNKTYYKFKVGSDGALRIPRSVLNAAGLPSTVKGSNFILYREGQEVPLYASAENMAASDYLEFWGKKADGKLDKQLYVTPSAQPDDRISLFTDTACYYLTWDAAAGHARYADGTLAIPATPPAAVNYCIATVGNYYKTNFCGGAIYDSRYIFCAADFDKAEGYVDAMAQAIYNPQLSYTLSTPNLVAAAPVSATLNAAIVTQSLTYNHEIKVSVNGQQLADSVFGGNETKSFTLSLPASGLNNNNSITFDNLAATGANGIDLYGLSFDEIIYPRNLDVSGLSTFSCKLPASSNPQYVEFLNFSGVQPKLYDPAAGVFFNGDVNVAGKARFYLPASLSQRIVLLTSATAAAALPVNKTINFTNYSAASKQANYVIVTNKALAQSTNGHNYIQDYQDYRASVAGGSYVATSTDVTDLYDAFAYGYDIHPLAVRNYLRYAYDTWTLKPQYLCLIGRGILYSQYALYRSNPSSYNFPIVPTYGDPGSDVGFVNFGTDKMQKLAVGRISVWTPAEIGVYLQKVKDYEAALKPAPAPTVSTEFWKKQVLHIAAASADSSLQGQLKRDLAAAGEIIKDTLTGYRISADENPLVGNIPNPNQSHFVDSTINGGITQLTYYGHASPNGFEYALNNPEGTVNGSKLPYFLALGCDVSQMFALSLQKTIAERWVLHPGGGAIAVMAADNLGYPDFLTAYLNSYYQNLAYRSYGKTLGMQVKNTFNDVLAAYGGPLTPEDKRSQMENLIFDGDPAVSLYSTPKPDYHIPSGELAAIPGNVSTSTDSFRLRIVAYNLGRAIHDTAIVEVKHKAPNGSTALVHSYKIVNLASTDTTIIWVPVNKLADLGLNSYIATIDPANKIDETNENNNQGTLDLFIYSDNLVPVYPKEFAIINQQGVTLKASTLNPFRTTGRYRLELDTTMLFNSPLLQQTAVTSAGGVIKWKPNLTMQDSVVYYWRTAFDSVIHGDVQWTASSFIYLAQGSPGWNQSHYYQYTRDAFNALTIDPDRIFRYTYIDNSLTIHNTVLNGSTTAEDVDVLFNGEQLQRGPTPSSFPGAIQIGVIDSANGKFWKTTASNYGCAIIPYTSQRGTWVREFNTSTAADRLCAAHYLDSIPAGNYVLIKNVFWDGSSDPYFISTWRADSATNNGKSLYHSIKALGFDAIDNYTSERAFTFFRKKGYNSYPVQQLMTDSGSLAQHITLDASVPSHGNHGAVNSTVIGPAKAWQTVKWNAYAIDGFPQNDSASVSIYGIDSLGAETFLYNGFSRDTSLAFIPAKTYPNIRMVWGSGDTITNTPPQGRYWRVLYSPVPEAALNPAVHLAWIDSLHVGQTGSFSVAIENLTEIPMDSMLVRFKIIDASGNAHLLANKRFRPLPGGDTLHASLSFDPAPYVGSNNLFVEANPDGDQREQYHPNNLGYLPLKVIGDKSNPLLDVTFDGQHILDGDIVSAKPFIHVMLKDENQYLALDDTGLMVVEMRYPNDPLSSTRRIPFDGTTCKFIPAQIGTNGRNEAAIELRPDLAEDGRYELFVTGKDKSGNVSGLPQGANGQAKYQSSFEVINKPMITNVLNYPNPFSTSTAFIFTLTGSQLPSQFKIQILTVTGKVVREILKEELGPLHIGRNITEYKWDGKDQYGQLLGNGVYMYRVATSLNGNDIERYEGSEGVNANGDGAGASVDKYFKHGWGKMYIMR